MNKTDERRLREQNATLTVQVQDSRKRIAELEERLRSIEYAADAADEAAERIRSFASGLRSSRRRTAGSRQSLRIPNRGKSLRVGVS